MVPDIFYPILTLKMTVLAFYTKKIGGLAPTRASPWTPWWAYSSPTPHPHPPYPAAKKTMRPYFLWIIPWYPCALLIQKNGSLGELEHRCFLAFLVVV